MIAAKENNSITFHFPGILQFGAGCLYQWAQNFHLTGLKRLFIITIPPVLERLKGMMDLLKNRQIEICLYTNVKNEPTFYDFIDAANKAEEFNADSIAGIGGGSVMDLAKVTAALLYSGNDIESVAGTDKIIERKIYLICSPTTSGTGSEVSPIAIITDYSGTKTSFISQYLIPDVACVDPLLTLGIPPDITAYTGFDALTHCIEAYANRFAHPVTDMFALEGIRKIASNLINVYNNGNDIQARSNLSLGSLYGGMCLGTVNTAAVHALAYPLGNFFKIPHGLANAVLLPYVIEFNIPAAESRYANIAVALGINNGTSVKKTAESGVALIKDLIKKCHLPSKLSDLNIPEQKLPEMADVAAGIQRLLKNNPKEITSKEALKIYKQAF
jgi:alcohol dehydrogenase class IV